MKNVIPFELDDQIAEIIAIHTPFSIVTIKKLMLRTKSVDATLEALHSSLENGTDPLMFEASDVPEDSRILRSVEGFCAGIDALREPRNNA